MRRTFDGVTADDFRRIALSMPDAVESAHMNHPDFRAGTRVFATLGYPDDAWAMVKLSPEEQRVVTGAHPEVFTPVKGGWGSGGATNVRLAAGDEAAVRPAVELAWQRAVTPRPGSSSPRARAAPPAGRPSPRARRPR